MLFAQFLKEGGDCVGIVEGHLVNDLNHDDFIYKQLPENFDPLRETVEGNPNEWQIVAIRSNKRDKIMSLYPPAKQLNQMRKSVGRLLKILNVKDDEFELMDKTINSILEDENE